MIYGVAFEGVSPADPRGKVCHIGGGAGVAESGQPGCPGGSLRGPPGPGLALVVDVLLLPMAARYTCTFGEEASVSCLLGMNKSRPLCSGQGGLTS